MRGNLDLRLASVVCRGVSGSSVTAAVGGFRNGGAVVTVINRNMFKTKWQPEVEVDR